MEKTLKVALEEHRKSLLENIARNFEREALEILDSNYYSANDCAIYAKSLRSAAKKIREYK